MDLFAQSEGILSELILAALAGVGTFCGAWVAMRVLISEVKSKTERNSERIGELKDWVSDHDKKIDTHGEKLVIHTEKIGALEAAMKR